MTNIMHLFSQQCSDGATFGCPSGLCKVTFPQGTINLKFDAINYVWLTLEKSDTALKEKLGWSWVAVCRGSSKNGQAKAV